MNDLLNNFVEQLKGSSGGTKVVAALVGAAMLAIAGLAAVVSNKPDYQLAFSGLSDHELPRVTKALAESGVPFDVSQPPGPFTVFVDEDLRSEAYRAAYGAGALDKPLKGIMADSGASSVFNSAEERQQTVRKREWGEMEKMLELLDFVVAAQVRSSPGSSSPLASRTTTPTTASVTLIVAGARMLSREEAGTVANLVSRGLGVDKQHLIIADQSGRSLYDGAEKSEDKSVRDLLARQEAFEQRTTLRAEEVLRSILGPGKARVSIASEWDYEQSTKRTETAGKGAKVSETKNTSERPVSGSGGGLDIGGPVGVSANVPDAATGGTPPSGDSGSTEPLMETTLEEKTEYQPDRTTEERVKFVPTISRLSVALFLDSNAELDEELVPELEAAIKAAVGFEETRDNFSSVQMPFFNAPEPDPAELGDAAPGGPTEAPTEPNPLMDKLLRRGVEIVTALVFVMLLLKSLKTSSKKSNVQVQESSPESEIDPELLARVQIEELLKSDPDKVGAILSSWARDDRPVTGARS
jgi:flagellar M-ring protein FliF